MQASNYLEDMILNYFFRNQQVAQPGTLYLALYTTDPTDADTGAEVTGGAYKRQPITFTAPSQQNDKATVSNAETITFDEATSNWGEVAYFGVRTALTGGNLLAYSAFNKPTKIVEQTKLSIEAGNIKLNMA